MRAEIEIKTKQALHMLIRLYSDLAGQEREADMMLERGYLPLAIERGRQVRRPPLSCSVE